MLLALASCNTSKEILYIQDVETGKPQKISPEQSIMIQPKDMMSIVVSSKDPQLAAMFNLPVNSYRAGVPSANASGYYLQGYVGTTRGTSTSP